MDKEFVIPLDGYDPAIGVWLWAMQHKAEYRGQIGEKRLLAERALGKKTAE